MTPFALAIALDEPEFARLMLDLLETDEIPSSMARGLSVPPVVCRDCVGLCRSPLRAPGRGCLLAVACVASIGHAENGQRVYHPRANAASVCLFVLFVCLFYCFTAHAKSA